eukprot:TRINITY_DN22122_c0_g1_i2.p1 TRINITY_DN22122_c0_g1~~TRINITY_DN22122_c0_g1_i2.p1  ORF type:complete len:357 (+),score=29.40 TRINITY_DN22122_c0_g1_i2:102-1172(+)
MLKFGRCFQRLGRVDGIQTGDIKSAYSLLQHFFKSNGAYYDSFYNFDSPQQRRREKRFGEVEEKGNRSHKLRDLNDILKKAQRGTTIDMQGLSFSGKSQVVIKKSLKLTNGTISINGNRVLIDVPPGMDVAFFNVKFIFKGDSFEHDEPGSLIVMGGKITMDKCTIRGGTTSNASGLELYGRGCQLILNDSVIQGFCMNQLHIYEGAHAVLNSAEISNSELGDGVYVCGEDSHLEMYDCKVHSIHGNCVSVSNYGKATLDKCQIYRSLEYVGIWAESCGSVDAIRCRVHSTYRFPVSCQDVDSQIVLEDCHIGQGYQFGLSLFAKDQGKIMLKQCKPLDGRHILWSQKGSGSVLLQ